MWAGGYRVQLEMMNEAVGDQNQPSLKGSGEDTLLREITKKKSSENVLGALFLQLPTIQKYTGFEVSLTEMTLVRWQIKLTEGFVVKQIY